MLSPYGSPYFIPTTVSPFVSSVEHGSLQTVLSEQRLRLDRHNSSQSQSQSQTPSDNSQTDSSDSYDVCPQLPLPSEERNTLRDATQRYMDLSDMEESPMSRASSFESFADKLQTALPLDAAKHGAKYGSVAQFQDSRHSWIKQPNNETILGDFYRKLCFTRNGIYITISINVLMALMNTVLILYELFLIVDMDSFVFIVLPLWYLICDAVITGVLLLEIAFSLSAAHACDCCDYLSARFDHVVDVVMFVLSLAGCVLYTMDWRMRNRSLADINNLWVTALRVIRDVIRVLRCAWLIHLLYSNLYIIRVDEPMFAFASPTYSKPDLAQRRIKKALEGHYYDNGSDQLSPQRDVLRLVHSHTSEDTLTPLVTPRRSGSLREVVVSGAFEVASEKRRKVQKRERIRRKSEQTEETVLLPPQMRRGHSTPIQLSQLPRLFSTPLRVESSVSLSSMAARNSRTQLKTRKHRSVML